MDKMNLSTFNFKYIVSLLIVNFLLLILFIFFNLIVRSLIDNSLQLEVYHGYGKEILSKINYEIINTGTSHGYSVYYQALGVNGLNLAKSGQSFEYDLEKLKYYNSLIGYDTKIIIPVSFHSFCNVPTDWLPHEVIFNDNFPILGLNKIITIRNHFSLNSSKFYNNDFVSSDQVIIPLECDYSESLHYLKKIMISFDNVILITTPYLINNLAPEEEFVNF